MNVLFDTGLSLMGKVKDLIGHYVIWPDRCFYRFLLIFVTSFWAEVINSANYIQNQLITKSAAEHVTPHKLVHKEVSTVSNIWRFGSFVWTHISKKNRDRKMDANATEGIRVGFHSQKTYREFSLGARKIKLSRDVKLDENKMPEASDCETKHLSKCELGYMEQEDIATEGTSYSNEVSDETTTNSEETPATIFFNQSNDTINLENLKYTPNLRNSMRMNTGVPSVRYENSGVCLVTEYRVLASTVTQSVPFTFKEAVESSHKESWLRAMQEEMTAMKKKSLNTLSPFSKQNSRLNQMDIRNQRRQRRKSPCFQCKAHCQRIYAGEIDFFKLFAPVTNYATIRSVLATAVQYGWYLKALDVKTAFLNTDLEEEIFVNQRKGFEDAKY